VKQLERLSKVISAKQRLGTLRVTDVTDPRSGPRVYDPQRAGDADDLDVAFGKYSSSLKLASFSTTAILFACILTGQADEPIRLHPVNPHARKPPAELVESFAPPEQYRSDFGNFQSPLLLPMGRAFRVLRIGNGAAKKSSLRGTGLWAPGRH